MANEFYCISKVFFGKDVGWKNINKNNYRYEANAYFAYSIDTYNEKYLSKSNIQLKYDIDVPVVTSILTKKEKDNWISYANVLSSYTLSFNAFSTLWFERLNSNIYKNIFPDKIFDMSIINEADNKFKHTTTDIAQESHGLQKYDVVYFDDTDGLYKKCFAEETKRAFPVGIVSEVQSNNIFTILNTGRIEYPELDVSESCILYVSDKQEGQLSLYSEISNMIYIPVAIYTDKSIIINIQQGSVGDKLLRYKEYTKDDFDEYDKTELNDIIKQIKDGVM